MSLIIGGICVVNGDASVTILVIFVVIGWIAHGIAYLYVGIRDKYSPDRGCVPVLRHPASGAGRCSCCSGRTATVTVLVRVIGVGLLLTAALEMWAARQIRKGAAARARSWSIERPSR